MMKEIPKILISHKGPFEIDPVINIKWCWRVRYKGIVQICSCPDECDDILTKFPHAGKLWDMGGRGESWRPLKVVPYPLLRYSRCVMSVSGVGYLEV